MKTEQNDFLKKITGMDTIPFVSAGIASDATGFVVSEDATTRLVEAAMNNDNLNIQVTELRAQLTTANEAKVKAENDLAAANKTIGENATTIKGLETKIEELEEEGNITQTGKEKKEDKPAGGNGIPFHDNPNNSFNQIADKLFGKPKEKSE